MQYEAVMNAVSGMINELTVKLCCSWTMRVWKNNPGRERESLGRHTTLLIGLEWPAHFLHHRDRTRRDLLFVWQLGNVRLSKANYVMACWGKCLKIGNWQSSTAINMKNGPSKQMLFLRNPCKAAVMNKYVRGWINDCYDTCTTFPFPKSPFHFDTHILMGVTQEAAVSRQLTREVAREGCEVEKVKQQLAETRETHC